MDSGLNRLKDGTEGVEELNRKKICFWFTYCFDRALSLNFGRSPNYSEYVSPSCRDSNIEYADGRTSYDISVGYPQLPEDGGRDVIFLWFDIAKLQGNIYEKLYSAKAQVSAFRP
jgi:hypothetical protein|tara:strand:+ start:1879 stop:2223 length:345 start_codon:yes stop_codon:yes gene_type:complete